MKAKVGKQRLRTLKRTKRLKLQLRVNRAARVAIKVTTRRHGKTIRLGSRSQRIAANQWVKVNVRLSKTQLRKLRKGKRVRIAFKASAGDTRATLSRAVRAR